MRAKSAPRQPPRPLDARAAHQLVDATRVALSPKLAQYRQQNPDFLHYFYSQFDLLDSKSLIGMTPDQANTYIQSALVKAVEQAADMQQKSGKYLRPDVEQEKTRVQTADAVADIVEKTADSLPKTPTKDKPLSTIADSVIEETKTAILKANSQSGIAVVYLNAVQAAYNPSKADLLRNPTREWGAYLAFVAKEAALNVTQDPLSKTAAVNIADTEESSLKAALAASTNQVVSETEAKTAVQQFQPPDDVSCSMSVMSWKETSDIFGRRVANTFVAIQVTLRNLNTKNEFLVHDIQVAIDTGVSPAYFGRFQAGRDKLLVRAVAQRGQSEDRRNLVLNTLQAAGAIAAAGSIATGSINAKNAVAVFQGAFIPGFSNIFPDHTVEQLNHINDLVFSASNTSKVLVPIQGSVPLVTFVAEKPIEELPFAWCGHSPNGPMKSLFGRRPEQNCEFNQHDEKGPKSTTGSRPVAPEPKSSGDIVPSTSSTNTPLAGNGSGVPTSENTAGSEPSNSSEAENAGYVSPYRYSKSGRLDSGAKADAEDASESDLRPWSELHYKDWKGAALRMLQEHTFVVVGGVHIQEVVTQPKIAHLDCPTLTGGQVDISQLKDGMVNCTVTGSGLGLVTDVSLEKGSDKIVGKFKAASDGNSATLQFKPDDMCDGEGVYSLYLSFKSTSQKDPSSGDSGESVSLAKQASVDSVKLATNALTITGKCLDQITDASLAPVGTENGIKGTNFTVKSPTEATASFSTLADQTSYYLIYDIKAEQNKPIEDKSATVTFQKPAAAGH
jgi:hypothetical protein